MILLITLWRGAASERVFKLFKWGGSSVLTKLNKAFR